MQRYGGGRYSTPMWQEKLDYAERLTRQEIVKTWPKRHGQSSWTMAMMTDFPDMPIPIKEVAITVNGDGSTLLVELHWALFTG